MYTIMRLINIYDSAGRIAQVDSLVEAGEFSSRTELYRSGALLMVLHKNIRDLSSKAQLDPAIFGKHIKECLSSIQQKNTDTILDELRFIINGLIFRELTSILLTEEDDRISFETFRTGLQNYEKTLMKFNQLEQSYKDVFFTQLENDLNIFTNIC